MTKWKNSMYQVSSNVLIDGIIYAKFLILKILVLNIYNNIKPDIGIYSLVHNDCHKEYIGDFIENKIKDYMDTKGIIYKTTYSMY